MFIANSIRLVSPSPEGDQMGVAGLSTGGMGLDSEN